jgi:predicted DNA-binding transcriptional regulator YafY
MPPRGRNETLRRVLTLATAIADRDVLPPIGDLAERFNVSRRTIFRDLDVLRDVGWNVPPSYHFPGDDR